MTYTSVILININTYFFGAFLILYDGFCHVIGDIEYRSHGINIFYVSTLKKVYLGVLLEHLLQGLFFNRMAETARARDVINLRLR